MKKKVWITNFIIFCLILCFSAISAEPIVLTLQAEPVFLVPILPLDSDDKAMFAPGWGGVVGAGISTEQRPWLVGSGEFGFDMVRTSLTDDPLSLIRLGAGAGLGMRINLFEAWLSGHGGYYYGFYGASSAGNLYYDGSLVLMLRLGEAFTLKLEGGWRDYCSLTATGAGDPYLLRTAFAGIGVRLEPAALQARTKIKIDKVKILPLFPTLMKYYSENSLGQITFTNAEASEIRDVEVSFFAPAYMDRPTRAANFPAVKKGQTLTVDLLAVFNPKILGVTEGTVAQVEVAINYKIADRSGKATQTVDAKIYDRNALSWDDDRKAATFITTKDPAILTFAKNISSTVETTKGLGGEKQLRVALGIHEALSTYGIQYSPDPSSPYTTSRDGLAVDFIQFPAQTLQYKTGDCDDLTVLYCTLLESIGIETAMLTTPGHIFPAFALAMGPAEAESFFSGKDDFIVKDGKVWLPIEITLIKKGFTQAWRQALREYSAALASGEAGFFNVRESWTVYEPVGLIDAGQIPSLPDKAKLEQAFKKEYDRLIDVILPEREKDLKKKIEVSRPGLDRAKAHNRLGIFYARLGLDDLSKAEFETAKKDSLVSAEVNLGNLSLRQEKYADAVTIFGQVLSKDASNVSALFGHAQAAAMAGQQQSADASLAKLRQIDVAMAEKISGVVTDRAARASQSGNLETSWQEE